MSKKTKAQALLAIVGILVSLGLFGEGVKAEVGTERGFGSKRLDTQAALLQPWVEQAALK
jgi:hypothetical protein